MAEKSEVKNDIIPFGYITLHCKLWTFFSKLDYLLMFLEGGNNPDLNN